jgi:hypothetical protein
MNLNLPPVFFYAAGGFLAVFGAARAFFLGIRRPSRELDEETPARAKARRGHLIWGIVHCLAGIVLILMTSGVIRSRLGP